MKPPLLTQKSEMPSGVTRADGRAMTLVEVAVAMGVLAFVVLGIMTSLIQTRRLTELAIYQNSANTIMQGYLEQIKNMDFTSLTASFTSSTSSNVAIQTQSGNFSSTTTDVSLQPLTLSDLPVIDPTTVVLNSTLPSGVKDNAFIFDVRAPGAQDLNASIWVWVENYTGNVDYDAKKISVIYRWRFKDGNTSRYFVTALKTIRASVPTFQ